MNNTTIIGNTLHYLCHATHKRVQKYRARACRLEASL